MTRLVQGQGGTDGACRSERWAGDSAHVHYAALVALDLKYVQLEGRTKCADGHCTSMALTISQIV